MAPDTREHRLLTLEIIRTTDKGEEGGGGTGPFEETGDVPQQMKVAKKESERICLG